MLTKNMLETLLPGVMFATGETFDTPGGVNMTNSGKRLRWVAVRGKGMPDWAIYIHWATNSAEWIMSQGDKVCNPNNIKKLVPCDEEAFARYRY